MKTNSKREPLNPSFTPNLVLFGVKYNTVEQIHDQRVEGVENWNNRVLGFRKQDETATSPAQPSKRYIETADIARAVGVSDATVRRILTANGHSRKLPRTRQHFEPEQLPELVQLVSANRKRHRLNELLPPRLGATP